MNQTMNQTSAAKTQTLAKLLFRALSLVNPNRNPSGWNRLSVQYGLVLSSMNKAELSIHVRSV